MMKVEALTTVNLREIELRKLQPHHDLINDLITRNAATLNVEPFGEQRSLKRQSHVHLDMHQISCAIRRHR